MIRVLPYVIVLAVLAAASAIASTVKIVTLNDQLEVGDYVAYDDSPTGGFWPNCPDSPAGIMENHRMAMTDSLCFGISNDTWNFGGMANEWPCDSCAFEVVAIDTFTVSSVLYHCVELEQCN